MQLALTDIRQDGGTQPRAMNHAGLAEEYAEAMQSGAAFPPVVAFFDGSNYWLADGFHRIFAAEIAGLRAIDADVRQGTQQDAQWYSYSANKTHGKRRSDEDKRRAVEAALAHPYHAQFSNRQIAEHIGVSAEYISRVTPSIDRSIDRPAARTVTRNGKTYQQNTANIGKAKRKPAPQPQDDEDKGEDSPAASSASAPVSAPFTPIQELPAATPDALVCEVDRLVNAYGWDDLCQLVGMLAERVGLEVRG